jgi:AraC family transcriptional regulator, transcriptional activator of pobA
MASALSPHLGPIVASRRVHAASRPGAPRVHDTNALSLHLEGHASFEQREVWKVGPGDLTIVPAGEPHRFLESKGSVMACVGFDAVGFSGLLGLLDPIERVREGATPIVRLPRARQDFVASLFAELGNAPQGIVQASLLTVILDEVRRHTTLQAPQGTPSLVARSLAFIERNCLGPISLEDVARSVDRSPAHVTTAIKKATGKSAGEWIIAGRMAEARRLLRHSEENSEAIAERVGYADSTHFIRMFKRHHGTTPAAWRRSLV